MKPKQLLLQFGADVPHLNGKLFRDGLSSIVVIDKTLWLTCDESTSLERLSPTSAQEYSFHKSFNVTDFFELPSDEEKEIDIEGMDFDGDYLWIVGSHSLKRKKPKPDQSTEKQLSQLSKVSVDENRYLLAKIPVAFDEKGEQTLQKHVEKGNKHLFATSLKMKKGSNELMKYLRKDEHFADFLAIPGKDNGFDIEGLAIKNGRLFIGLRGPVLRGWACILELNWLEKNGHIELEENQPYIKHFINLDGMGIRELYFKDDDLYILAGPTMDLDGTISVFKWKEASKFEKEDGLVWQDNVERLLDIPHGSNENRGKDKAEGMAFFDDKLLIVYDSPALARCKNERDVYADLFEGA